MNNKLYILFRFYIKIVLFFFHKKIIVFGTQNIPDKGPVLFIANHQNALIDALLIPTTISCEIYFLSRASAFRNKWVSAFLKSLNMIPVFRLRDGIKTIKNNVEVFEKCVELLKEGKGIEIFAEGEHHLTRKIIPLKKGFARIVLATLQKYPDLKIQIVPIGLNFDSHLNFPSSVSVIYGKPILANEFIDYLNPDIRFLALTNKVKNELKKLTLHIENKKKYDEIIAQLMQQNIDFLNPEEANKMVINLPDKSILITKKNIEINWWFPFHLIAKLNSIFPLLIWWYIKPKIKEIIFISTFRFALIATAFPIFYLIQTAFVYAFFNLKIAIIYLLITILLGIISTKTMKVTL
ncbi:1-acyl-sn-glycerol-3-phosphate acyltransferase [Lutibacter sp.]|uniref:1-acyl-sn-glycerol-3-phosphate acyltransferase n=1 Tax=Lutibacter sp. TaxID=1925666 RepID=UPI002732DB35|nr:1-acyl-sn-glycerol-3-phosphate acyltransferase [Lutibacter sp.]MDP3314226.1 1-acyl-sn-glycerol-3-phosphate acyltransferase [Lutibacter sp.]